MTFEILWPLIFAVAVPIIILLYLLRPKGTRKVVPSNLIWRRLAGANTQASFLQRFFSVIRKKVFSHKKRLKIISPDNILHYEF